MLKTKNKMKLITVLVIAIMMLVFNLSVVNAATDENSRNETDFDYIWVANEKTPINELAYVDSRFDYDKSEIYISGLSTANNPADLYIYISSKANIGQTIKSNKGNFEYYSAIEMYGERVYLYKLPVSNVMDTSYANEGTLTFEFKSSNGITTNHKVTIYTYGEKRQTIKVNGNEGINFNGVGVTNVVSKELKKDDEAYIKMFTSITANQDVLILYAVDIDITGNLQGEASLTFNVGKEQNGKTATVYHQKHNGDLEVFKKVVRDGKITIVVTEFSPFMVAVDNKVDEENEENQTPDVKPTEPTKEEDQLDDEPKTGVIDYTMFASIVVMISLGGIAILKYKK